MSTPAACAPPDSNPKRPSNPIPAGACDCHFHVFDGPSDEVADRSYSASEAPLVAYKDVQKTLGIDRGIIVQPSIYGTDNETTLAALSDPNIEKAVVVVEPSAPLATLKTLSDRGAVGARVNLLFSGGLQFDDLTRFARQLAEVGWHLQILADVLGRDLVVTGEPEGSVLGAAAFAYHTLGMIDSFQDMLERNPIVRTVCPETKSHEFYQTQFDRYMHLYWKFQEEFD